MPPKPFPLPMKPRLVAKRPATPIAAGNPCVGCGLCCDGTLFTRTKVRSDEQEGLAVLGFSFFPHGKDEWFAQPCLAATAGRCVIYADRPHTCQKYRCALLEKFEAGEVALHEARAIIERAFDLIEKAVAVDPSARHLASRSKLRTDLTDELTKLPIGERKALGEKLLAIVTLDAFLDDRFRKPTDETSADGPNARESMSTD